MQQRHAHYFGWHFRGNMWVSSQLFSFITSWCPCGVLIKKFFLATSLKRDKKNWGASGGKGCMCIKDWFKQIFHLCLNLLFYKLKFLISKVDLVTSPPSPPLLLTKPHLGAGKPCCYFNRNNVSPKYIAIYTSGP